MINYKKIYVLLLFTAQTYSCILFNNHIKLILEFENKNLKILSKNNL